MATALQIALRTTFELGLMIGPHLGYLCQYWDMRQTSNITGYARLVSLILLISYTLRIFYFVGHPFAVALLFQSFGGVMVHAFMIHYVLEVEEAEMVANLQEGPREREPQDEENGGGDDGVGRVSLMNYAADGGSEKPGQGEATQLQRQHSQRKEQPTTGADEPLSSSAASPSLLDRVLLLESALESRLQYVPPSQFLLTYGRCVLAGVIFFSAYYFVMWLVWPSGAEVVGYVALGFEAMLVLPQVIKNARRHSTHGLDRMLVFTWVCGDTIKMVYFTVLNQPLPFLLCGGVQLLLDCVVIVQLIQYPSTIDGEDLV